MTPAINGYVISDTFTTTDESLMDQVHAQFVEDLNRRKQQKIINAIGEKLCMTSMSLEFLMGLAKQVTCYTDDHGNESYYLNGEHIVILGPMTITREGNVMTAHQAYGPVELK